MMLDAGRKAGESREGARQDSRSFAGGRAGKLEGAKAGMEREGKGNGSAERAEPRKRMGMQGRRGEGEGGRMDK